MLFVAVVEHALEQLQRTMTWKSTCHWLACTGSSTARKRILRKKFREINETNLLGFFMSVRSRILNSISLNLDFFSVMGIFQELLLKLVQFALKGIDSSSCLISALTCVSGLGVNLKTKKIKMDNLTNFFINYLFQVRLGG